MNVTLRESARTRPVISQHPIWGTNKIVLLEDSRRSEPLIFLIYLEFSEKSWFQIKPDSVQFFPVSTKDFFTRKSCSMEDKWGKHILIFWEVTLLASVLNM